MHHYTLLYSKIWKQVASMILVPVCLIIPLILILSHYPHLTDAAVFIIIFAALGIIILVTLYFVFKQAHLPVEVSIESSEMHFRFKRKSLFNRRSTKTVGLDEISFFTDDEDVINSDRRFFTIKLKSEWGKIILLSPKKANPEEMEAFATQLSNVIEQYNLQNQYTASPIKQESFYTTGFSKTLTYIFVAIIVAATIIKVVDSSKLDWYRIVWMYVLSGAWFTNIYIARKKENARRKL